MINKILSALALLIQIKYLCLILKVVSSNPDSPREYWVLQSPYLLSMIAVEPRQTKLMSRTKTVDKNNYINLFLFIY